PGAGPLLRQELGRSLPASLSRGGSRRGSPGRQHPGGPPRQRPLCLHRPLLLPTAPRRCPWRLSTLQQPGVASLSTKKDPTQMSLPEGIEPHERELGSPLSRERPGQGAISPSLGAQLGETPSSPPLM